MADDCLEGFQFLEQDDITNDAMVKEAAEIMFKEIAFDGGINHLGAAGEDTLPANADRFAERLDDVEKFDFTEGFEFVF